MIVGRLDGKSSVELDENGLNAWKKTEQGAMFLENYDFMLDEPDRRRSGRATHHACGEPSIKLLKEQFSVAAMKRSSSNESASADSDASPTRHHAQETTTEGINPKIKMSRTDREKARKKLSLSSADKWTVESNSSIVTRSDQTASPSSRATTDNTSSAATLTTLPHTATKKKKVTKKELLPEDVFPLRLDKKDLVFMQSSLGEGEHGQVAVAKYGGLLVACKCRRSNQSQLVYNRNILHELRYAAKLSMGRFINPYIGVFKAELSEILCSDVEHNQRSPTEKQTNTIDYFIVQRYYENGDLRDYLHKLGRPLHPCEVLTMAISLFSAVTDAHHLNIGIVDLKMENMLESLLYSFSPISFVATMY
ncbi:uncharacterized protein BYT42DRAFT_171215 [Radiomyces spectabilis]|uniref:uncharacterized protein n=1 Tax=Radiomyces spectabilis TaxID=64574 RepID=UPI00221EADA8|nr:uncharacterized protein BYT42DRAFT_171215 [Radiomyces spectabilis]KAI8390820.1 hypothetical protein BYT42DRAFT_171215 [Radiomyces spectabilis]